MKALLKISIYYFIISILLIYPEVTYSAGNTLNMVTAPRSDNASSITNVTFSTAGNWNTASNWSNSTVPNSDTINITIDANCTITGSFICNNLTINSSKILTIAPGAYLKVNGTLTNNAGTSGLVIQANSSTSNGSLVFSSPTLNPTIPASVQMFSDGYTSYNANSYMWQFFGIPVQSQLVSTTFTNVGTSATRIRQFNESGTSSTIWTPSTYMTGTQTLYAKIGYEIVQPAFTTYTFSGNLFTDNGTTFTVACTNGAPYKGFNILSNPYTASIDISKLSASNFGAAFPEVYLYNSGGYNEWTKKFDSSDPGIPGCYTTSSYNIAGNLGVPSEIPSMQGFVIYTTSATTFTVPYSALKQQTERQKVKTVASMQGVRIEVSGTKQYDKVWLFSSPSFSNSYDAGYDGQKMMISNSSQLYVDQGGVEYQIGAINNFDAATLKFKVYSNGTYKFRFYSTNLSGNLYLIDTKLNTSTNINNDSTIYSFTGATTDSYTRFKLTTTAIVTDTKNLSEQSLNIKQSGNSVELSNNSTVNATANIYNLNGALMKSAKVAAFANLILSTSDYDQGVYILKFTNNIYSQTKKIIIQ